MTQTGRMSELDAHLRRSGPSLKRVLHADDDLDILELADLALNELGGLEVLQLSSGRDLIETALSFEPDLILLDVMMPDLSGEELIHEVRGCDQLECVPVVFMTAKGNQMAKDKLLLLGAAAVVVKPFDPTALADQLRRIYRDTERSRRS
jgi:DNA-binding response OmpR family regulator